MDCQLFWVEDLCYNAQLIYQMGSAHLPSKYEIFNWEQIQQNCYRNKFTRETILHSRVDIDSQDQLSSYKFRVNITNQQIVRLLHYSRAPAPSTECLSSPIRINLYIQGSLHLFTKWMKLNEKTSKCYCMNILKAFTILKQYYGPFEVAKDMIWIKKDIIKVWVNSNPFSNEFKSVKEAIMALQVQQVLLELECPFQNTHKWSSNLQSLQDDFKKGRNMQKYDIFSFKETDKKRPIDKFHELTKKVPNNSKFERLHVAKKIAKQKIFDDNRKLRQSQKKVHYSLQYLPKSYDIVKNSKSPSPIIQIPERKSNSHYIPSNTAHKINFSYQNIQTPSKKKTNNIFINYSLTPMSNFEHQKTNSPWKCEDSFSTIGKKQINMVNPHLQKIIQPIPKLVSNEVKGNFMLNIFQSSKMNKTKKNEFQKSMKSKSYGKIDRQRLSFNQTMPAGFKKQLFASTRTNKNDKSKVNKNENTGKQKQQFCQISEFVPQNQFDQQTIGKIQSSYKSKGKKIFISYKIAQKKNTVKKKQQRKKEKVEDQSKLLDQYIDRMHSHKFLKLNSTGSNSFLKKIESFQERDETFDKRQGFLQDRPQSFKIDDHQMVNTSLIEQKNKSREQLKKEMQSLLNIDGEEQKSIRKKVQAKKAYFADLKAQAFKILS